MLSYMLPIEDKPPPIPNKNHLQLELELQQQQQEQNHNHVLSDSSSTTTSPPTTSTTTTASVRPTQPPPPPPTTDGDGGGGGGGGGGTGGGIRKVIIKPASKASTISSESSVSSITSDAASSTASQSTMTPTDKPKPKIIVNGTKHGSLKRVSFGSSKGSMVETLIYESPLQEEPEASPILETSSPFPADGETTESEPSKRVRVTFFESEKPLVVTSPEPSDFLSAEDLDAPIAMTSSSPVLSDHAPPYNRQASTESGWDNPFRPDGDLSREADEIVEMIKGGKPITPTPGSTAPKLPSVGEETEQRSGASSPEAAPVTTTDSAAKAVAPPLSQSSPHNKVGANGNAPCSNEKPPPAAAPGAVEVQRGTVVPPSDASQVEHVVLKKKPKCKCCVIQ